MIAETTTGKNGWEFDEGDEIVEGITALRVLGGGWRYEAYLAFDERLHYPVVVKAIRPDQVDDEGARHGLRREIEVLEQLNHPVIARMLGADPEGGRPHVVLEHVEGPRLSSLIRRFGPLELDQIGPLAAELGAALHYLHGLELVHLDVKPKNIIMGAPPRLIDMSIARSIERARTTDHPIGTDAYLAPEQAVPERGVPMQAASDVWGLGVTIYESLTGTLPFGRGVDDEDAPPEERWPQLVREPEPLSPRLPAGMSATIWSTLEPRPEDRPTAREVAESMEPLLRRPRRLVLNQLRPR
ncbi:MAG: serine/threonine-protein kinase [Actinomycetota bacterium]